MSQAINRYKTDLRELNFVLFEQFKLAELLSARRVGVNSFHHQAAKRIGEGLTVSATSPDGIVEGLEMRDRTFVVAVQWHPENFWKTSPVFDGLFTGFVEAARRAALSRRSPRSS